MLTVHRGCPTSLGPERPTKDRLARTTSTPVAKRLGIGMISLVSRVYLDDGRRAVVAAFQFLDADGDIPVVLNELTHAHEGTDSGSTAPDYGDLGTCTPGPALPIWILIWPVFCQGITG